MYKYILNLDKTIKNKLSVCFKLVVENYTCGDDWEGKNFLCLGFLTGTCTCALVQMLQVLGHGGIGVWLNSLVLFHVYKYKLLIER